MNNWVKGVHGRQIMRASQGLKMCMAATPVRQESQRQLENTQCKTEAEECTRGRAVDMAEVLDHTCELSLFTVYSSAQ